jgi:hypothetical protein
MDNGVVAAVVVAGAGAYVAYRLLRSERFRRAMGSGVRSSEKVLAFSTSAALKAGAAVAAGASEVAVRSGGGLLRAAKVLDRIAA